MKRLLAATVTLLPLLAVAQSEWPLHPYYGGPYYGGPHYGRFGSWGGDPRMGHAPIAPGMHGGTGSPSSGNRGMADPGANIAPPNGEASGHWAGANDPQGSYLSRPYAPRSMDSGGIEIEPVETPEGYTLIVHLDGIDAEELQVLRQGRRLILRQGGGAGIERRGEEGYYIERRFGGTERSVSLPRDSEFEAVTHRRFDDRVEIYLPRAR